MANEISGSSHANRAITTENVKISNTTPIKKTDEVSRAKLPTSDTLNITNTATQLQQIEAKLAAEPVVNIEKVDAIKAQIAQGTFTIDPEKVAEKLLEIEGMIRAKLST